MAKKRQKEGFLTGLFNDLSPGTKRGVWAVLFVVLGLFLVLAAFDSAGIAGSYVERGITFMLGVGYFLLPILFFILAYTFLRPREDNTVSTSKLLGAGLFFLASLASIELGFDTKGGVLGNLLAIPLVELFGLYASVITLIALIIIGLLLIFNTELGLPSFSFLKRKKEDEEEDDELYEDEFDEYEEEAEEDEGEEDDEEYEEEEDEEDDLETDTPKKSLGERFGFGKKKQSPLLDSGYTLPPLSLLEKDKGKAGVGDIKANANLIKRTLQNFNIQVEVDEVSIGPSVTRYALKPAEGVRLSKIVGLQNNIELALAAHPVRIEAPIPGKSLVGIEVPNTSKSTIGLATLLNSSDFTDSDKSLLVGLGRDITGNAHFGNIAKMPHLLIAGATGSGKSVTIHTLVTSLLYRNPPSMLRFIMVDPKRVELTLYNDIPHLLTPVITDPKKSVLALKWAVKEMDRRYNILQTESVRDIASYHTNVLEPALKKHQENTTDSEGEEEEEENDLPEAMPYIVIIIDELADLMQTYPREIEATIVRLAQMSRAVGIHLVLSTQRPSVNVITGLIKANIPGRIALQVASQIDSRTILDSAGAEKLLGAGDMLYISGEMSKPVRIQSAFISETEVKKVASYLKKQGTDLVDDEDMIDFSTKGGLTGNALFSESMDDEDDADDDLYDEARSIVLEAGKASTSYLQRRLRIGYSRAARLMDILEDRGVIGPADGSRPREILEGADEDDGGEEEEEE